MSVAPDGGGGALPAAHHQAFMREALELARQHVLAGHGGPFGAVIVREGQVVARGWNQVTTTNDPTAHAEVVAVRAACQALGTFELAGCVVYTSCEPCPMCLAALWWARVERIYYAASRDQAAAAGFDDEAIYREVARPLAERELPLVRVLEGESEGPFDVWRSLPERVEY